MFIFLAIWGSEASIANLSLIYNNILFHPSVLTKKPATIKVASSIKVATDLGSENNATS
jgi:hypothetical protein